MAKTFNRLTAISGTVFFLLLVGYCFRPTSLLLSLCITCGVIAYHLVMRLLVGTILDRICQNRIPYTGRWFQPLSFEVKLYTLLRVKSWKAHIPTYSPDTFSPKKHSFEEIAQATCQAEIVHETIVILSLLPILLAIPFGKTLAEILMFVITSLVAALIDLVFVVLQRFNRPRLLKLAEKTKGKHPCR